MSSTAGHGARVAQRGPGRKTLPEYQRRAFTNRLHRVMDHLGWSPKDLTERIGRDPRNERHVEMTRSWVRGHEGKEGKPPAMPDLPVILRIAEETGAALDYLLLGIEPAFRSHAPRQGESFEEHFRRATVEHLVARCDYDPVVSDGLLANARVLWRVWISAVANGVELRMAAENEEELRTTRRHRLTVEEAVVHDVKTGIDATTEALTAAREKGLKRLLQERRKKRR